MLKTFLVIVATDAHSWAQTEMKFAKYWFTKNQGVRANYIPGLMALHCRGGSKTHLFHLKLKIILKIQENFLGITGA